MRKILFRAKRKDNGQWVRGLPFAVHATSEVEGIETWDGERHLIIPETLGQCTGVKDSNGNLVYEGDIIQIFEDVKKMFNISDGAVRWVRGMFCIGYSGQILSSLDAVASFDGILRGDVIGNIFDTPDLLEEMNGNT